MIAILHGLSKMKLGLEVEMEPQQDGCEVWLLREGCVVTRFHLDLPAGMLVEQITSGKWRFSRFGQGKKLTALRQGERLFVWAGSEKPDLDRLICGRKHDQAERVAQKPIRLTERQRQVLDGLACGKTLAEIGFQLGIRARSVRHHVDALKLKLGAVSLGELVARAITAGWLTSTPPQGGTGAGRRSDHPKKH
jgi:DNA-binding CsgD family transcriptional regulator